MKILYVCICIKCIYWLYVYFTHFTLLHLVQDFSHKTLTSIFKGVFIQIKKKENILNDAYFRGEIKYSQF